MRLRDLRPSRSRQPVVPPIPDTFLYQAALREIERLTAENEILRREVERASSEAKEPLAREQAGPGSVPSTVTSQITREGVRPAASAQPHDLGAGKRHRAGAICAPAVAPAPIFKGPAR